MPVSRVLSKNGHLSGTHVAARLKPPLEGTHAGQAWTKPPPFFTALLRIEFTGPVCLQKVGELLPRLSTLTGKPKSSGGISLLHWSGGYPRRVLPVILPYEARTFLIRHLSML